MRAMNGERKGARQPFDISAHANEEDIKALATQSPRLSAIFNIASASPVLTAFVDHPRNIK